MYIDPSSGGMLFQIFAVVFGLVSGTVLMFGSRIKMSIAKFRRSLRQKNENSEVSENKTEEEK